MKNIVLLFCVAFTLFACDSALEEHPKSVAAETFYNTVEEASAAVLAPLNKLRGEFNGMSFPTMQEASADYSYGRGSWTEISDYLGLNTSSNITRAGTRWGNLYGAIRDCNIALSRLPEATEMSETEKSAFIGELRFIRGFAYYYLVRLYRGCPLRTENNMTEYNLAKSSVDEIYNFLIDDFVYASNYAPATARVAGTPTKYAASGMLSDVYLQLQKYKEAASEAKKVIDSGKYALIPVSSSRDFDKVFGANVNGTSEEVFYLKNDNATGNEGWPYVMICAHPKAMIDGQHMLGTGIGWYGLYTTGSNKLIQEWDDADLRKKLNLVQLNFGLGDDTYLFCKFYDPGALGKNGAGNDWPVLRYPDVLLNYAEATARQNGAPTAESMEMVNIIRRRAYGYNPTTVSPVDYKLEEYNTLDKFIGLLVKEEGYECMNEAKRWLYLCRLGVAKQTIKEVKEIDVADKHLVWPIPVTEFNYNTAMDEATDQNPGY